MFMKKKYSCLLSTALLAACSHTALAAQSVEVVDGVVEIQQDSVAQDRKIMQLLRAEQKKLRKIQERIDRLEKGQKKAKKKDFGLVLKDHFKSIAVQVLKKKAVIEKAKSRITAPMKVFVLDTRNDVLYLKKRGALRALSEDLHKKIVGLDTVFGLRQKRKRAVKVHLEGAKKQYVTALKAFAKAAKNMDELDSRGRSQARQALNWAIFMGSFGSRKAPNAIALLDFFFHDKEFEAKETHKSFKNLVKSKRSKAGSSAAHRHVDLQKEVNALRHDVQDVRRMLQELKAHLHKKNKRLH